MGNYIDQGSHTFDDTDNENVRKDPTQVSDSTLPNSTEDIEIANVAGENLNYHIFSYKQYMPFKERFIYKWASAKLALTEELIRTNIKQCSYLEPETDYLTDDEMDELSMDKQLRSLENYRNELVELTRHLSLRHKSHSRKRKKNKRLKRRKLLAKKRYNQNLNNNNDSDSEVSKLVFNLNCAKKLKRSPFKIRNY